MNKVFILLIKESNAIEAFGSLKQLINEHGAIIERKIDTLYRVDFDMDDYEDRFVKIMKRSIKRSKQRYFI